MPVDAAFANAGKKPGLEIWRIEKLKVVQITDQSKHGSFYSGDSYICLRTIQPPGRSGFEWNVHFWLGKESSQDEQGVAAYKTVELDDSLGGGPVQYREVQGHETELFLSYFKKGMKILAGGIDSGFRKVERGKYEKRLLHLKGKRTVRVNQVDCTYKSLNEGDVFVLDNGMKIYQWNGKDSSRSERAKGLEVTKAIRDQERGGKAHIIIIDQGKDDDSEFFKDLGDKGAIKSAKEGGDDAGAERAAAQNVKLYKVSDASGRLQTTEVASRPLKKDMLDTNDCFILDCGGSGVFAWCGKKSTKEEKSGAMKQAMAFIDSKGYPKHTPCSKVVEGGETPLFKSNFASWPVPKVSINTSYTRGNIAKVEKKAVDVKGLHRAGKRDEQNLVDDGSGTVQIWRIEDFDKVPVDKDTYGQFYGGDSYIVFYTYLVNGKENYIIYYWQGLKSSQDEKGASAILATKLDDEYGGAPVQVRVVMNKEPQHFIQLFKGKMIVHEGGRGSSFKNSTEKDSYDTDGTRLFHVKGTNEWNTRAVQVEETAASLNSNDSFVLETPKGTFVWFGKGCSGDERETAKKVASVVSKKGAENVMEGSEPADFWSALGGKGAYASDVRVEEEGKEPRLFQCSNASGNFSVTEVFDFDQSDLVEDDVMLLDTYDEVYVWVGTGANATEKKEALQTAVQYVKTDPSGRDADTPIYNVKQGFEPPNFTSNFLGGWDHNLFKNAKDSYEQMKGSLMGENAGITLATAEIAKYDKTYTIEELQKDPCPEGVDPVNKEQHLSDADFKKYFGMSKEEYGGVAAWKRNNLKKKVGLF